VCKITLLQKAAKITVFQKYYYFTILSGICRYFLDAFLDTVDTVFYTQFVIVNYKLVGNLKYNKKKFSQKSKFSLKIRKFWENLQTLVKFTNFGKIYKFWEKLQILGNFTNFWKIYIFWENLEILGNFRNYGKI